MKLHKYKEESISILKQLQESGNITESLIDTKSLQHNIIQFKKQNTNKAAPSSLSKYNPFEDVKSPNFDQVQKQIKNNKQQTRPPSREQDDQDSLQAKEVAASQMRVNRKGSKGSKHNNQQLDSEEGSGSILASGVGVAVG